MSNAFGRDILLQTEDQIEAARFYVEELGFEITSRTSNIVSFHGTNINLFIERGPALGPVLEVTVESVQKAKENLKNKGCSIIKDEPEFPRCYVKDPNGLIYNPTE
jgi:catechol 2,3-dioxygenase-like lactoylglutathione lyase family enzyme